MHLTPMACAVALLALLGWLAGRAPRERGIVTLAALLALGMIMSRGYYWQIFPRGTGFFTANRVSALALLLAAYWGTGYFGARAFFAVREMQPK